MIEVKIPVKKYVLKYLIKRYGTLHTVSKTSLIGSLVLVALENKVEKPDKHIPAKHQYSVSLPEFYFNTKGHTIPRNKLQYLGNCLEVLFKEDMRAYLELQVRKGLKAQPELKLFLQAYDITEDDIKLESLYKNWQRYCEKKQCA